MAELFSGGKVFDGTSEPVDGMAVMVEEGRIARVAPVAEFDGYAGPRVDTAGATLMPGLIDCHIHLCLGAEADIHAARAKMSPAQMVLAALGRAQATLAGGVTAIRDCGGMDYLEFAVRDACNSGAQLGPTIRASGKMICMTGGHGNAIGRVADGCEEVVRAVREQIHAGADFIKIMATGGVMTPGVNPEDAHYSPEEMRAGIQEGKRFHKRSASHAQGTMGILNAVRGGVDSIEHGIFMTEECVQEMIAAGTYLVPTLAAGKGMQSHLDTIPEYVRIKSERIAGRPQKSLKMYYDAGGKIAMGTDAGVPYCHHGDNAMELEYMVEAGMTALDAMRSATSVAAELLDLDDEGRIAEGAAADLLIVDGDPTTDIAQVSRKENHRQVRKRGLLVS